MNIRVDAAEFGFKGSVRHKIVLKTIKLAAEIDIAKLLENVIGLQPVFARKTARDIIHVGLVGGKLLYIQVQEGMVPIGQAPQVKVAFNIAGFAALYRQVAGFQIVNVAGYAPRQAEIEMGFAKPV